MYVTYINPNSGAGTIVVVLLLTSRIWT